MATITVAGPFNEGAARQTASDLGESNHSVYSRAIVDGEGFETDEREWFVERDTEAPAARILGYSWEQIKSMQQRGATR